MNIDKKLIEKAKTAKSAEELLEIAKGEGMELTADEAEKYFARLHKTGELADEELDNVSGGCTTPSWDGRSVYKKDVKHLYHVGQTVEYILSFGRTRKSVIEGLSISYGETYYFPTYTLREVESGEVHKDVSQGQIEEQ